MIRTTITIQKDLENYEDIQNNIELLEQDDFQVLRTFTRVLPTE